MKNIQIRIVKLIFVFLLMLTSIAVSASIPTYTHIAYASEYSTYNIDNIKSIQERTLLQSRRVPTLADDFVGNRVIVTLRREFSNVNGELKLQNFVSQSITTRYCLVAEEFWIENYDNNAPAIIESIVDLTHMENPDKIVSRDTFSQILSIELAGYCKQNVLRVIYELEKLDKVLAAEPDFNILAEDLWLPNPHSPNDTYFGQQWGLGAAPGAQIAGLNGAWAVATGHDNPRIRVGLFETGIDASHPDLRVVNGNLTSFNPRHGTHVGGIIGAITNNNRGIAGIAQVELALLDRGGGGILNYVNIGAFPQSLIWAIDNNIRIANASFGFIMNDHFMREPIVAHAEAIRVFGENGGLLVAAAGNFGTDEQGNIDLYPVFPASYGNAMKFPDISNVITVGAINEAGVRRFNSNFGIDSVHIFAPGDNILSTVPRYRPTIFHSWRYYAVDSGTSYAAPHVTGVAALLLSINPNLTAVELRDAIINNADTIQINAPGIGNHDVLLLNGFATVSQIPNTSFVNFRVLPGTTNVEVSARQGTFLPNKFEIPSTINIRGVTTRTYTVTNIAPNGFANQPLLTNITIPNTVTHVGEFAFSNINSNAVINILGRTATPSGWNQNWNPHNRLVKFDGVACSHEYIIQGNVKRCIRCDNIVPIQMLAPVHVGGFRVRNTNSSVVDVWLRYQEGFGDWQTQRVRMNLRSNEVFTVPDSFFDIAASHIEVWFEINGVMSNHINLSGHPITVLPPIQVGDAIFNPNNFDVNAWIIIGKSTSDEPVYYIAGHILAGQTSHLCCCYFWHFIDVEIWFEINGFTSSKISICMQCCGKHQGPPHNYFIKTENYVP